MSSPAPVPRFRPLQDGGEVIFPTTEGEDRSYRILRWAPPRLLLARGDEIRAFFVAPGHDGVWLSARGITRFVPRPKRRGAGAGELTRPGHEDLSSPMPGKVLELLVGVGDAVAEGQRLVVVEAMKMETPLRAHKAGYVSRVHVQVGGSVQPGETLLEIDSEPPAGSEP